MPDDARELAHPAEFEALPIVVAQLPLSLQIFFDDALFKRCQTIANYMADAAGFVSPHLKNNPKACFAVVSKALTWRLDPYAVAQATYATPGGQIGYYGSLCQAIIENSGRLKGGIKFEHYGEWPRLRGKFKLATGSNGGKYPVADWRPEDEEGLGVRVVAQIRDEAEPRVFEFDLAEAYPRNSTLWATSPRTQICYTAVRRFASSCAPSLFMGVPFDREDAADWAETLKDVTPRPELREFRTSQSSGPGAVVEETISEASPAAPQSADPPRRRGRPPKQPEQSAEAGPVETAAEAGDVSRETSQAEVVFEFADEVGEIVRFAEANEAIAAYADLLDNAKPEHLDALIENGAPLLAALAETGRQKEAAMIAKLQVDRRRELAGEPSRDAAPANDAAAPDPLHVPLGASVQAWFQPARAKLRELDERTAPAAEFRRFREVNQPALDRLKTEFRSWHAILDKILTAGESRMAV